MSKTTRLTSVDMMRSKSLKPLVLTLLAITLYATRMPAQQTTLISITNFWKYDQSGADLSGQFNLVGFDDSSWPVGQGLLGRENTSPYPYPYPILTPLSVGGGRITYYFRWHFNFAFSPEGFTLIASNYVDDGAVFYLNGVEVGRVRMGAGPVNAATLAANVNPEGVADVVNFPASLLVKGLNLITVEVHQNAAASSDIVFGMSLTAIPPAAGPVVITAQPISSAVEEGEPVAFTAGVSGTPPYFYQWFKDGAPIDAATNSHYAIPAAATNDAGVYAFVVSNAFSRATSSNALLTVTPPPFMLFSITNIWKYNQSGTSLGTAWRATEFDDSAWPSGRALFYNENVALPAPKNTPLSLTNASGQSIITYYLRTHFIWTGNPTGAVLTARALIDDGAVIYLNGVEARRIGMPAGNIAFDTPASRSIGDATSFEGFVLPTTNLLQGDNVLAVEVHQVSASSTDVVFGMALGTNFTLPQADLIIWGSAVNPRFEMHTFNNGDCELNECAIAGTRRLLRFDTETRNIGTADLLLGDPSGNPLFQFDPCHQHYHFAAFAEYRLMSTNGLPVAVGHKVGFCLEDLSRWDAAASVTAAFDCSYQGIQKGWADIYSSGLPCQYIDITGLPPGDYILELEIDPENRLAELNESNNVTRVPISIAPACTAPPSNDNFSAAQIISARTATVLGNNDCATKESGEPDIAGSTGGHSIWYRWTSPYTGAVTISTDGSYIDTVLALYQGPSVNSLTLITNDDDGGVGFASLINAVVTSNSTYYLAVDGYAGQAGDVVLNINPGGNDLFSSCLTLTGASGTVSGRNTSATKEPGEPNHAGDAGGHSLWYCWTATNSGPFIFDTLGSRFDTLLAIYTGENVAGLVLSESDNNLGPFLTSRLMLNAIAGTTYRIALDGAGGATGTCTLNWRPGVALGPPRQLAHSFEFRITGAVGDRYIVETSSNLTTWAFWTQVTNFTGDVQITDTGTADHRFYRVRMEYP